MPKSAPNPGTSACRPAASAFARGAASLCLCGVLGTSGAAEVEPHERILQTAQGFLEAASTARHTGRVEISVGPVDPRLRLQRCSSAPEAFEPPGGRSLGRTTVGVRCAGPRPWTLYVPAEIAVYGPTLVAARALQRGEELGAADVRVVEQDLGSLPPGSLSVATEAVGKRLKRSIAAGTPVTSSMLKVTQLVRRGQAVVLLAKAGGVQVRSAGKALDSAAKGERVRVENSTSGRVVEGIVVAEGVVQVSL
jgi:flagella basal body P-ring formation protein FlgA